MKLKQLIFLMGIISIVVSGLFAQELKNVEVQTIPLQDVRLTPYGVIVNYTTSNLYKGTFYFPADWFRSHLVDPEAEESENKVVGLRKFTQISLNKKPLLYAKYIDGKLAQVTLVLPSSYESTGIPEYRGSQENLESLKELFDKQASLDYLPFEDNQ